MWLTSFRHALYVGPSLLKRRVQRFIDGYAKMFAIVHKHFFQRCQSAPTRKHHLRKGRNRDSITNQFQFLKPGLVGPSFCRSVLIPDIFVAYLMRGEGLKLLGVEKFERRPRD